MIVIFSGPSGAGKSTVIKELISSANEYALMPTVTTRSPRAGETEGDPYHFVSKAQFDEMIKRDEFYEYQGVHTNYYGTSKSILKNSLATGKILLKDIDVLGTMALKDCLADVTDIFTIFLTIDKQTLLERLKGRNETDEEIAVRLSRYEKEAQYAKFLLEHLQKKATCQCATL